MDIRNLLMAVALFWPSVYGLATGAQAGETVLLFEDTDDLPPPYKQWWYATQADNSSYDQAYEVFIRGEVKRGDFFGILRVDCLNAKHSEWLATGGIMSAGAVPARAISELRQQTCKNGG